MFTENNEEQNFGIVNGVLISGRSKAVKVVRETAFKKICNSGNHLEGQSKMALSINQITVSLILTISSNTVSTLHYLRDIGTFLAYV